MILGYWDCNNFTLLPRVGRSSSEVEEVFRVIYFRWFGWTWCWMTDKFMARMLELIRQSPDEVATVAAAYAKIGMEVSQEVQRQTQWLRDSQSEQIAKRLEAENRCRVAEQKYSELVKSLQVVDEAAGRDAFLKRWRAEGLDVHLDDGK